VVTAFVVTLEINASGNYWSALVMAVWPLSTFTLGIYRPHKPQSTLHLAALSHV
jgi:hypothetical protein